MRAVLTWLLATERRQNILCRQSLRRRRRVKRSLKTNAGYGSPTPNASQTQKPYFRQDHFSGGRPSLSRRRLWSTTRDEKRLLRCQRQLKAYKLLINYELGYVRLSPTGAELLFDVFSQTCELPVSGPRVQDAGLQEHRINASISAIPRRLLQHLQRQLHPTSASHALCVLRVGTERGVR